MHKLYDGKTMTLTAKDKVNKGVLTKIGDAVIIPAETAEAGKKFTAIYDGIYVNLDLHTDANPEFNLERAYLVKDTNQLTNIEAEGNTRCGYFITTAGQNALMFKGI